MNQKHHVSQTIAKQLAEAGIVIESEYGWVGFINDNGGEYFEVKHERDSYPPRYPAPIATELLERLPPLLAGLKFQINRLPKGEYWVSYDTFSDEVVDSYLETNQSLPNALALLLIRLTKERWIDMKKQTAKEREDFYLDAFEMLNKPRRIFQGLEINAKRQVKDYSPEELDLVLDMIKEAKLDFYAVTLPKFEKRVNELNKID